MYLLKLSLADSITVEDDSVGLKAGTLVKLYEHLSHHRGQLSDDLLSMVLHTHRCTVATGVCIHACHQLDAQGLTGGRGGQGGRGGEKKRRRMEEEKRVRRRKRKGEGKEKKEVD